MACASTSAPPKKVARSPKVYQFRIELSDFPTPIWRLIQVPRDYTFFGLHSAIQDAFGWKGLRSYEFDSFSKKPGAKSIVLPLVDGEPKYECDYLILDYFSSVGHSALYVYDYQWRFDVVLEQIVDRPPRARYPVCVDGKRGCAREGECSVRSYKFHLEVAADEGNAMKDDYVLLLTRMGHTEHFNPKYVVFKSPRKRFQLVYKQYLP